MYYPVINLYTFENRFGSINSVIQLTCLCRESWRLSLGGRTW